MPDRRAYRWAVNCAKWNPTKEDFLGALSSLQSEERSRVMRFVFVDDLKRAMVGRLLLRLCALDRLGWSVGKVVNTDLIFDRTAKGRPVLMSPPSPKSFDFNVSHQGDYAVLAAVSEEGQVCDANPPRVGVDVMKIETARSKETTEFFRLMRRQLTTAEWSHVEDGIDEFQRLKRFYRFWCLKESYVKALGIGIGFDVGKLEFCVEEELSEALISSTVLKIEDRHQEDWRFEEQLLDSHHCVAVATNRALQGPFKKNDFVFRIVGTTELLKPFLDSRLLECGDQDWESYNEKTFKNNNI